jgi:hypothetical protein
MESYMYGEVSLSTVPLSRRSIQSPHFFIEHSPTRESVTSFVLFLVILLVFVITSLLAPPYFASQQRIFDLRNVPPDASINVPFDVSQISSFHRVMTLYGYLMTPTPIDLSLNLDVIAIKTSLRQRGKTTTLNSPIVHHSILFNSKSSFSSEFRLFVVRPRGVDTVSVRFLMSTDFSEISGLLLHCFVRNPSADDYSLLVRLLLSCFSVFPVVILLKSLWGDPPEYTHIVLAVMGIMGILASNPIQLFMADAPYGRITNNLFMGLFLFAYRMFVMM